MEGRRFYCRNCGKVMTDGDAPTVCPRCQSRDVLPIGVRDIPPRPTPPPIPDDPWTELGKKKPGVPEDLDNPDTREDGILPSVSHPSSLSREVKAFMKELRKKR